VNIAEIQPQNSDAPSVLIQLSSLKKRAKILQAIKDCHLQIGKGNVRAEDRSMYIAFQIVTVDK